MRCGHGASLATGSKTALWRDRRPDLKEVGMATYILLANFTQQGITNVVDTVERANVVKAMAARLGIMMKETFWTLGRYDVVAVFDAPGDATMTALTLSVARLGNIRTQTLRAFTHDEMKDILAKVE
jgi:uncharacterized protein with GYD domain